MNEEVGDWRRKYAGKVGVLTGKVQLTKQFRQHQERVTRGESKRGSDSRPEVKRGA